MGANSDDIRIRIAGDIADIRKSMQELRRETRAAGDAAKGTRADWRGLGRGLQNVRNQVRGVIGAYIGFRTVQAALRATIRNTIEQERVTAQLEARLKSTGGAAGLTSDQLLDMAERLQAVTTFGDEAIVGMQSLLLTFTQVRGDVFEQATRAILDMSIALGKDLSSSAQQVGKALNEPVQGISQLRESGVQLTAEQQRLVRQLVETGNVAGAQRVILAELETQFGGAAVAARETLGGAIQSLQNAFGDLLEGKDGGVDAATEAINELSEQVKDPGTVAAFQTLTTVIAKLGSTLVKAATAATNFRKQQFETVRQIGAGLGIAIAEALGTADGNDLLASVNHSIAETQSEIQDLRDRIASPRFAFGLNDEQFREQLAALETRLRRFVETRDILLRNAGSLGFGEQAGRLPRPSGTDTAEIAVDGRPALQRLQAELAAAGVLLSDELKRLGEGLDREFEDNLVRFADYYRRRAELEIQAIDQQIASQRAALDIVAEEIRLAQNRGEAIEQAEKKRAKLVAEVLVLERQRADVAIAATREQAEAERGLAAELEQVRIRLLEAQGSTVEARTAQLEAEFRGLLARLRIEADTEGEALVRRLIDVELAKVRLQDLEAEYQRSLASLAREEQRLQALIDTGTISEREGRRRIIALHQETADEVGQLIPLMRELAEATGDPEAIERLEELEAQVENLRRVVDRSVIEFQNSIQDAGENAFASFISGAQDASSAWDSFVDNVKQRAAELVSEGIFDRLFELFRGTNGSGGILARAAGFLASVFHDGGIAGAGGRKRLATGIAFAGAPRLHSGGLLPNEIPAILERGEEVLTRRDPRHRDNQGATTVNVSIQARDADSFRRQSPGQIGAQIASEIERAKNRNR